MLKGRSAMDSSRTFTLLICLCLARASGTRVLSDEKGSLSTDFTYQYRDCPNGCGVSEGSGICNQPKRMCLCGAGRGGWGCSVSATRLRQIVSASDVSKLSISTSVDVAQIRGSDAVSRGPADMESVLSLVFANDLAQSPGDLGGHIGAAQLILHLGCAQAVSVPWARQLERQGGGVLLCADAARPEAARTAQHGEPQQHRMTATAVPGATNMAPFRDAVVQAGLEKYVVPMYAASPDEVGKQLAAMDVQADVIYMWDVCNAGRDFKDEVPQLLKTWWSLLAPGGLLVLPECPHPTPQHGTLPPLHTDIRAAVNSFGQPMGLKPVQRGSHLMLAKPPPGRQAQEDKSTTGPRRRLTQDGSTILSDSKGRTCDPQVGFIPQGWSPQCAMRRIYIDHNSKSVGTSFVSYGPWGNLLGPYYQGLSVAQLMGYTFNYLSSFSEDWLTELPRNVPPGLACPNTTELRRACEICDNGDLWEFTHMCPAGWTQARPAIQNVTNTALETWAQKAGKVLPSFEPTDAVIQVRCAKDTLLSHSMYGPVGFNFYTNYMPPETKRVFVLFARHGHNSPLVYPPCERIVEAMGRHITSKRPDITFQVVGGEKWEDYARLIRAPVVFREASSSWGLWATLASTGRVFSPPILSTNLHNAQRLVFDPTCFPYVDETYKFVNVSVLYPALAKELGFQVQEGQGPDPDNMAQIDRIIQWMENN